MIPDPRRCQLERVRHIRDVRPEPLQLPGELAEHGAAIVVAHGLAAPGEIGVVGLEQTQGSVDER